MFDAVLVLKLLIGAQIIGFADYIALIITEKDIDMVEATSNGAVAVRSWL